MVERDQPETIVKLVGGLGNQLFGYAAGRYLEQVGSHKVVYDTSQIPHGFTNHNVSLVGRKLEGKFAEKPRSDATASGAPGFLRKLRRSVFEGKGLGWDPRLSNVRFGTEINGYFQTYRYFSTLTEGRLNRDALVRHQGPSKWLIRKILEAEDERPVILHLRRGDYRKLADHMGLVGFSYFLQAIGNLESSLKNQPIWVFSDESREALELVALVRGQAKAILQPAESDPGETLVLMSYGEAHILSNSTFGWWSSILSPSSKMTIVPNPWLRGLETPRDLFPPHWVKAHHLWQEEHLPVRKFK